MKKKLLTLLGMLLLSTALVAGIGAYLDTQYLEPVGLFQDKSLIEIPFAAMKDPAARFAMSRQQREEPEPEHTETMLVPQLQPYSYDPLSMLKVPYVPPFEEITENWFDDALFIGDSRTVGLRDFARLGDADYFCSVGMTVFDALTLSLSDADFESMTLSQLLREKRYSKIYICLGLNECGYPYELLMEGYGSLLDTVARYQPDSVIILHGMITVSRIKAASKWCFELENLNKINAGIQKLANGTSIRYIDANEHFADSEGYLPYDATPDGCHFYKAGYREWADWIFENAQTLNISFG